MCHVLGGVSGGYVTLQENWGAPQRMKGEYALLLSARQRAQELPRVHVILESLAPIDEDYGDLIVVLLPQFEVGIDVHLAPLEAGLVVDLRERVLDQITEMTALTRIDHHVVHRAIVNAGA
jgi:hypothetical protein